jgi:EAL domain-containing protein (putative c-di-GMP-specific phosphodiesterase class I)
VPPDSFIPVAESTGLAGAIGLWVLDRSCAQIAEWQARGADRLRIAVNLSAEQFVDPQLVAQVRAALDRHRVDPSWLELELTESAATSDHCHTRAVFSQLRDLGVRIAIDDIGTGFASLSQLRRLPFDKLKIDREFVSDVHARTESQAICRALIALGDGLGIDVLAEGTETEHEIAWLSGHGCRLFQGFGFSRPVPSEDLHAAIAAPSFRDLASRCRPAAA